ncbi:MAG: hypothetical protein VR70_14150 [Rhodospirillaceae bacterium BRH_c57]|nr:MAG: hypothetical protein VR70_14150 [Rhodospirillaceae bacterium BRH_c57]
MGDVSHLSLDDLLAPLDGDNPCGEDLRYEGLYDSIRDLRQEDDPAMSQGVWETDIRQADWAAVRRLTEEALTSRSKDLQIAAWLTEALARQGGLTGLAEGCEFMARLCDLFWDDMYPELDPDDDDLEGRLSPVEWLATQAQTALSTLPLTKGPASGPAYTWQTWISARRLEALASSDAKAFTKAVQKGEVPMDRIKAAASQTPLEFYEEWRTGLNAVTTGLASLKGVLDHRAGSAAPSFRPLLDQINEMRAMIDRQLGDRGVGEEDGAGEGEADDEAGLEAGTARGGPVLARPIGSRQEAYSLLQAAANYLQATEPHSPTPYLVRRAVRWGGMSLNELLSELGQDSSNMDGVFKLLRLRDG